MKNVLFVGFLLFLMACSKTAPNKTERFLELEATVSLMEYDFEQLEDEILKLGQFSNLLYDAKDTLRKNSPYQFFDFSKRIINSEPGASKDFCTVYVSELAVDLEAIKDLLHWTLPLELSFKKVVERNPNISQIYFNSPLQVNKLYPPYAATKMLEPDLDLRNFNFFYEGDFDHNPSKGIVWIKDTYLDPVGKGWMVSLVYPVYVHEELLYVIGFDITLRDIIETYVNQYSKQLLIIDKLGRVVAGKSRAIEALSLPPLKDHTYSHTITTDSFRPEEFNLFKSKNPLVRKLASDIILGDKNEFFIQEGFETFSGVVNKFEKMDWFLIDLSWQ